MLSRYGVLAAVLGLVLAGRAFAADQPQFVPAPAWVDVAATPPAPPADGAAAVQVVLDDNQSRLSPEGDAFYNRRIYKVLRPEGLVAFKTQGFTWDPQTETLLLHSLKILRDGQEIDLLKGGADMPVLRRETNLERAMLDGRLTVSRQIEGLQTGDMIELAFTRIRKDPILQGRSQDFEKISFPGVASRYRVKLAWPDGEPVRWKATSGFLAPQVSKTAGWNQVVFDGSDLVAPKSPAGAPLRFRRQGELEVSSFQDWADVSKLMYPLYAKAMVIAPDSPLKAEAAAIRKAHDDPGARAFAALQLVEQRTRYLFLGMNDGGYVPAAADLTWQRKFGDCKGKTVLLLALLKELGIAAEPALVSVGLGDGLDERLPGLAVFNHVLVRATIGGQVYWLDGTRTGDVAGLASLAPPPWRFALPVRAAGAKLEPIATVAATEPLSETYVRLDASKGMDAPAPARIEMRMHGDVASGFRQSAAALPRADLERALRQGVTRSYGWLTVDKVELADDVAHDAFTVIMTGQADIDWRRNVDLGMREFKLPTGGSQAAPFATRDPGPDRDAPYAVTFPYFVRSITEVVLPNGGAGFQARGPNDAQTVGGYELKRTAGIEGGVARFTSQGRAVSREVSAAEAEAANRAMRRMAADESLVRAPP